MTTYTGTISNEIPVEAFLSNNYPNPFNPTTKIEFAIPKNSYVTLKIYDNIGRDVSTLINELKSAGKYSIDFNGNNLASGVYYYKLTSDNFSDIKKMILVK